ncbi:hypothetical protein SAMN05428988_3831 [Chitinophaga sp. YR573]|uniref:hypothetical protein n=1 Tax=Chitinophaga sp. YR573 TaxID=1881040 RepID=UPI0008C56F6D|nr:hypothetical protein [Chitinophaga sp. YR573]SEW27163.1 hypothetical protein SAMN05428988_3831 [Chitinophaga sp. YR573]
MPSFGKKILSAFVELSDTDATKTETQVPVHTAENNAAVHTPTDAGNKFSDYFNKLFADANLPGPDYYEFSKMTEAMQVIADEKARYCAAFAGLQVQGLNKGKLLSSALEYVQILDADGVAFHNTIDAALAEKVQSRKKEMEEARDRIQKLSQEIVNLQQQMELLTREIEENETKIGNSAAGYSAALESSKQKLLQDIEKIKLHIL